MRRANAVRNSDSALPTVSRMSRMCLRVHVTLGADLRRV